jgi:hypothetical protein
MSIVNDDRLIKIALLVNFIFDDENLIARKRKNGYSQQNICRSNGRHGRSFRIDRRIWNSSWVCVRDKFELEYRKANP